MQAACGTSDGRDSQNATASSPGSTARKIRSRARRSERSGSSGRRIIGSESDNNGKGNDVAQGRRKNLQRDSEPESLSLSRCLVGEISLLFFQSLPEQHTPSLEAIGRP